MQTHAVLIWQVLYVPKLYLKIMLNDESQASQKRAGQEALMNKMKRRQIFKKRERESHRKVQTEQRED